jgi:hypothetical protein
LILSFEDDDPKAGGEEQPFPVRCQQTGVEYQKGEKTGCASAALRKSRGYHPLKEYYERREAVVAIE